MFRPLPQKFYEPSARVVAPRLLGHWLIRMTAEGPCGGPIVETEAYIKGDPACHAFRGETKRTQVMWGAHGRSYVYLIYGFYYCFNTVCRPAGEAEAVLVRAIEPVWRTDMMRKLRGVDEDKNLTSGPGKLCVALALTKQHNGLDLCDANSELIVAENPEIRAYRKSMGPMVTTTRIGINVAVDWPLRFYLANSPFVSKKAKQLPA